MGSNKNMKDSKSNVTSDYLISVGQVFKFQPINVRLANAFGGLFTREHSTKGNSMLRNSGILFLTVKRLSKFAYDIRGQVKDMRLLKSNVLFMLR